MSGLRPSVRESEDVEGVLFLRGRVSASPMSLGFQTGDPKTGNQMLAILFKPRLTIYCVLHFLILNFIGFV